MAMHAAFPLPDTDWEPLRPYWAAAAEGRIEIPRCDGCGLWCWYPRPVCRQCRGDAFTWTAVPGQGRLFSWSVVRHPFLPSFKDKIPFVTGLVTVDEVPGIRLATEVVDCDPDALICDQPVEAVFRPLSFPGVDGTVVAPLWRPLPA